MSQPTQYVLIFVVVGVQVGFAVLGMGGLALFFAHDALIALAIVGLVMLIVSLFTEGNLSSGEREDRGHRWVLAVLGAILDDLLPASLHRPDELSDFRRRSHAMGWLVLFPAASMASSAIPAI